MQHHPSMVLRAALLGAWPPYGLAGSALDLRTVSLGAPWPPYGLAGSALGLRTVSLGAPWSPYGLAGSALGCAPCAACAACADPAARAADSVNVWKHSKRLPRATEVLFHRRSGNSQNSLRVWPHCIDTELLVDGIDRSRIVIYNI